MLNTHCDYPVHIIEVEKCNANGIRTKSCDQPIDQSACSRGRQKEKKRECVGWRAETERERESERM